MSSLINRLNILIIIYTLFVGEEECPSILPSLSGNLLLWTQSVTTLLWLINFTWVGSRMYKILNAPNCYYTSSLTFMGLGQQQKKLLKENILSGSDINTTFYASNNNKTHQHCTKQSNTPAIYYHSLKPNLIK